MIYLLIPVFNEEANIPNLHKAVSDILPGEDKFFIFSDDGSSDQSIPLINQFFKNFNYKILGDGINGGPGLAFNTGFEWILSNSTNEEDVVVTLEADCTSDLTILPSMIAINRLGYELVLASVYAQGGGFDKTTFLKRVLSSVANLLYRFLFNIKIQTLSSFYRSYNIKVLRQIKTKYPTIITENGFICMLEILIKAIRCDAKIIEVPMLLKSHKRIGPSKMKTFRTTITYFIFLFKKNI